MRRRAFINQSAFAAASLTILPSGIISGKTSPNNKLNIALIGAWGRAKAHYGWLEQENVVALCDVNEAHFAHALKRFPKAKTYIDWRKCLDHKGLDAVVICTPDHHHAFISNWALNRGLSIFCEKPLALSVEEARTLRANWLANKGKLATQCGTQMHAQSNYRRVKEMILDGAIGEFKAATAWGNRNLPREGYYPAAGKPPTGLHWDLWLGPSPEHPYHPEYFTGRPGANCQQWNMFWDWGAGQIGDMGSHFMDLLYSVTDAKLPTAVKVSGEAFNPEVTPVELETRFDHPANDWRGPIRVSWYQGGRLPRNPRPFIDFERLGHGALFHGSEGYIIANYTQRLLIPSGKEADLSYYQPRSREEQLTDIPSFYGDWVDACKDPSKSTCCDFEYHSQLIEQMLLGLVAYRTGGEFNYDGEKGLTDNDAANALLKRTYREGWTLNG